MEKKTSKNKTASAKKAPKKTAKKSPKKKVAEVIELENVITIEEKPKINFLSTETLSKEIIEATRKSETFWVKIVNFFKNKILFFL